MTKFVKPWLIQRCTVKSWKPEFKVSEFLYLDYMGSAEFEYGAVPACLRAFYAKITQLVVTKFDIRGIGIWILSEPSHVEPYHQFLKSAALAQPADGPLLQESNTLMYRLRGGIPRPHYLDNFWFDLVNQVAIGLKPDDVLHFRDAVVNSVQYMDSTKAR